MGVGAAAVRLFHAEGARVSVVDRAETEGVALAADLNRSRPETVQFQMADVAEPDTLKVAIRASIAGFGTPDVLFNHAGTLIVKAFHDTSLEEWHRLFAINVHSMFVATQAVLPVMLAAKGGAIVNTSSVSAALATPMEVAYCTTKAACQMLTKAIATEYRDAGLRCNAVAPGFIATGHGLRELDLLRALEVNVTEQDIRTMQGRMCTAEEVAEVVLFLASDAASFVNGETLVVDNTLSVRT
jgi:NAD(P)-dependent dehydrogenase (short-subunit alcohol dehydrogenase family)